MDAIHKRNILAVARFFSSLAELSHRARRLFNEFQARNDIFSTIFKPFLTLFQGFSLQTAPVKKRGR